MNEQEVRDELDSLLNDALQMALRLLQKHGCHVPFCMTVLRSGEQSSIVADDTDCQDMDVLVDTVRQGTRDAVSEQRIRALAFARNVSYRSAKTGEDTQAIEVTLDHLESQDATVCYLPYKINASHELSLEELFASAAPERFFPGPVSH